MKFRIFKFFTTIPNFVVPMALGHNVKTLQRVEFTEDREDSSTAFIITLFITSIRCYVIDDKTKILF